MKRISASFVISVSGLFLLALTEAKPIMVTFGTSSDPSQPRTSGTNPAAVYIAPRTTVAKNPAPVSEQTDDVPNPVQYRAPVPHQYRTKLYSIKPPSSLILGTPLDQRYTPSIHKYDLFKKQQRNSVGVEFTGPHVFERQEYEYLDAKNRKTTLQPSVQYQHHLQPQQSGYVPQIGVLYSSGVRYYIPQIFYQNPQEEHENSVYDKNDQKHFYRVKQ